jgi:hypothetical protein
MIIITINFQNISLVVIKQNLMDKIVNKEIILRCKEKKIKYNKLIKTYYKIINNYAPLVRKINLEKNQINTLIIF